MSYNPGLAEHFLESGALTNDLLKTRFGANFVRQMEFSLRYASGNDSLTGESQAATLPLFTAKVALGSFGVYCALVKSGPTKV